MYDELIKRLHRYSENCVAYKLDADFADAVQQAADAIEEMQSAERKFLHIISDLESQIDQLKRERKWIPVTERLPEDGQDILAVHIYCGEVRIVPANYDRGVWYDCVFNRVADHITHWMPLPESPKEIEHED